MRRSIQNMIRGNNEMSSVREKLNTKPEKLSDLDKVSFVHNSTADLLLKYYKRKGLQ